MGRRVALVVGCNDYQALDQLHGAEKDAQDFFATVCSPVLGGYDVAASKLLLSPSLEEIRTAISETLFDQQDISVFTFFFAGHGGAKSGSYFLCLSDTRSERMSTTALPLSSLFAALNEAMPSQSNVVIDACNAGGLVEDLGTLLKPDNIGKSGSPSISLFAAASADEYAYENSAGGIATAALLKYLRGQIKIDTSRPYLDLVEIGRMVSTDLGVTIGQTPITWGLSLTGTSTFTKNPNFSLTKQSTIDALLNISPHSPAGQHISLHADRLWEEYRLTQEEPDSYRLATTLRGIIADIRDDHNGLASFILGLADSLEREAEKSSDMFGAVTVISTLASLLLPHVEHAILQEATTRLLSRRKALLKDLLASLIDEQEKDKFFLLNSSHLSSDLYWLPIRLMQILGTLWSQICLDQISGQVDQHFVDDTAKYTSTLFDDYTESFVAMSDKQAPFVYVMGMAGTLAGAQSSIAGPLNSLFTNLAKNHGALSHAHLPSSAVLEFLLARLKHPTERVQPEKLGNPSDLLAVLLALGTKYKLESMWDSLLRQIDHQSLIVFVPETYLDFCEDTIHAGVNNTFKIGHGIWRVQDFQDAFTRECAPKILADKSIHIPIVQSLVVVNSIAFPDRTPWFLTTIAVAPANT